MSARRPFCRRWAGAALAAVLVAASPAPAAIVTVDISRDIQYAQTGPNTVTQSGYFFSARTFGDGGAGDPTAGTLTYPGPGSPAALNPIPGNPTVLIYQSTLLPDQSTLDADYPTGTYTFDTDGTPTPIDVEYAADYYPDNVPALTAASYTGAQGLNAAAAYLFAFNQLDPNDDPTANEANPYFVVRDALGAVVFDSGALPTAATSYLLAANTLQANTAYQFEVIFSSRVVTFDGNTGVFLVQEFNTRTNGRFFTAAPAAVPEPAGLTLLGAAGLAWVGRRASRRRLAG